MASSSHACFVLGDPLADSPPPAVITRGQRADLLGRALPRGLARGLKGGSISNGD
jgi:hypothetical protein